VLQSDTLALQVIHNLQLDRNPRFGGSHPAAKQDASKTVLTGGVDDAQQQMMIDSFRSGLTITMIPNTRLIEIRYASPDPRLAANIVNALAQAYVENNRRSKYDSTTQASDWLKQQLADLQVKVETSEQNLADYQKEHGILGIDEKQNIITSKLDELNKQLTEAEGDRMQKQAAYNQMLSGTGQHAANDALLEQLRQQEADVKNQLAQATVQFGPAYPKVVELNSKLQQIEASIQSETRRTVTRSQSEYQAASQHEAMLRAALEKQKQEANKLNESGIQYNILKKEADTNRQLYDDLLQKLKEAGIEAGLKATNVRLVDMARVPLSPTKPNIPRNLALGLLLGLIGGVTLAFIVEILDNTVRTPEEVQMVSALPSLGVVPLSAVSSGRKKNQALLPGKTASSRAGVGIIAYSRPKSEIAEAYRALRTSILLSSLGSPPKVILVTSALPQEGKTTTSMNSAIVLAQKGGKVLLVDADLRRPGVHQMMGMSSRAGLSTVLTGSSPLEAVVQTSRQLKNLFILPAGPTPPQPAELLGSDQMRALMQRWREEYDHIVIDTPPALTVTDAVLLSPAVDAVILVIRSGRTPKDALRRARDLLAQVNARVMGVVVNAIDLQSPDMYYYYYGAKQGGHYYDENAAR
jgi:capsular exopolysaccharide synthesis family protein